MKTDNLHLVGFLALALTLSSCSSAPFGTATNVYTVDQSGQTEASIGDRELANKFVLVGIKREQKSGRTRVQFDLKNTTPGDLRFEWTVLWKDASGFNVPSNEHWRPTVVPGKGFQPIHLTAPTPEAVVFQLHFRRPTPVG